MSICCGVTVFSYCTHQDTVDKPLKYVINQYHLICLQVDELDISIQI